MSRVLLSGLHSDANPSPGLGTARSLRLEWPDLRIEGVDYSPDCTGLSDPVFAAVHVLPRWAGTDPGSAVRALVGLLGGARSCFLSGLDLEAQLLAERGGRHPALLVPPARAFPTVRKPGSGAAALLGLRLPAYELAPGVAEAAAFATRHGWPVWVKGPHHEAHPVGDLPALREAFRAVRRTWHQREVLVQEHVAGTEESYAFAAVAGRLVGACHMAKTLTTSEGKTWAGRVVPVSGKDLDALGRLTAATGWTGGGEVEIVRDRAGERHLLEVNPRFPAWIYGAALLGVNLPALLLAAAVGRRATEPSMAGGRFVRIVTEIPAGPVPAGDSHDVDDLRCSGGKRPPVVRGPGAKGHPSGMPLLSGLLAAGHSPGPDRPPVEPELQRSLDAVFRRGIGTPVRLLLPDVLESRLAALADVAARVRADVGVPLDIAYSVKTNPAPRLLGAVREAGLMVEAISQREVRRCLRLGFDPSRIVLTGPGKWWPWTRTARCRVGAVLCDSIPDLERALSLIRAGVVGTDLLGVRIAPVCHSSRFGVRLDDGKTFGELLGLVADGGWNGPWGVHFHLAASQVGGPAWLREVATVLHLAARLGAGAGVGIHTADLGGGWPAGALPDGRLEGFVGAASDLAARILPGLERILIEPGKSIAEPSMALFATVLGLRRQEGRAAVLDASVAELPDSGHVRPVLWRPAGRRHWSRLGPGPDTLLGRLCMENDTIAGDVALPASLAAGDTVAFLDVGAYDASMSYRFGQ
ncbi:hypothetical protein [Streptosporangium sp. H16]|uniref:hypothetical protein n=1 Tax=Streptosporangium sp. H16 TaxID=3444184 RepID=UPI003F7ABDE1